MKRNTRVTKSCLASTVSWARSMAPTPSQNLAGRTLGGSWGLGTGSAVSRHRRRRSGRHRARGRLRELNVPTIVVENNEKPGDSWRKRYKSLCLHDPVWYDHLPKLPFPRNWPVFSPKDKIGDFSGMYSQGDGAQLLGLHRMQEGILRREAPANGPSSCSATARKSSSGPSSSCLRRECQPSPTCRNSKAWTSSRAISTIRRSIRGRTSTKKARWW